MKKPDLDIEMATVLARLDQTTLGTLLSSFSAELVRMHKALSNAIARITALEVSAALNDTIINADSCLVFEKLPRSIVVEASSSLSAEAGFYMLEYDDNGQPYRWTGPKPLFFFELFVDRSREADMRLRCAKLQVASGTKPVRCYVDGVELEIKCLGIDGEHEISAVLLRRDFVGGTVITFECASGWSPSEQEHSKESRRLGLAFRWLKIDSVSVGTNAN